MPIIRCGEISMRRFRGTEEPFFEVALGGLPVLYSILKPFKQPGADDRYKLSLRLTPEQYEEVRTEFMARLKELNREGGYGATEKQLEEKFNQVIGPCTTHEGSYRFFGSKLMAYRSKDTGEYVAASMNVYDAEGKLIEGGVALGSGSIVRSKFSVSLFKKDKQIFMNLNPISATVLHLVEPPKRESVGHEGLDDSAYDF